MIGLYILGGGGTSDFDCDGAKDIPIDVAGLHLLLNDSIFAKELVPMVSKVVSCFLWSRVYYLSLNR